MKKISLTQGKFALVDDEDFEYLNQWKWTYNVSKGKGYVVRKKYGTGDKKGIAISMHRTILKLSDPNDKADHKDGDGLNNQRSNLRVATQKQNCQNRKPRSNKASKFKGVSIERRKNYSPYWVATIVAKEKQQKLGRFPYTPCGELLSAIKYDEAASKNFGEFANLNFK